MSKQPILRICRDIADFWNHDARHKVSISGLSPAAASLLATNLLGSGHSRFLFVCSTPDVAAKVHQDFKTWISLLDSPLTTEELDFLPGWEHSPYQSFSPSLRDRIRRLRTLWRLTQGKLRIVVCSISALTQLCPPKESLLGRTARLAAGDLLDRDTLVETLQLAGYTKTDLVEDPGQFAFRGGIFDFFSPAQKSPMRIEFFGDEIESLRFFDSQSQRSLSETLRYAEIIPVTDFTFTPKTIEPARTAIKEFCDERGVPKQARDDVFLRLDAGSREPWFDYLAPYFSPKPLEPLSSYLEGWSLAYFDQLSLDQEYDKLASTLKTGFEKALEAGQVVAPPEALYADSKRFRALRDQALLELDSIALGVPQATPEDAEEKEEQRLTSGRYTVKLNLNLDLRAPNTNAALELLSEKSVLWSEKKYARILVASTQSQAERARFILEQKNIPAQLVEKIDLQRDDLFQICSGTLSEGFRIPKEHLAVLTDAEVFGPKKLTSKKAGPTTPTPSMGSFVSSLEDLNPKDLTVHLHHGVGRYLGLVKLEIDKIPQDFLLVEYAGSDKLYLPVYRLDQIQRYVGPADGVTLDKLGSAHFEKTKEKVKAELQDLANQLLKLYAQRASRQGFAFSPTNEEYREFEARFPYAETPDQLKSIEDTLADMESGKIMDRLICGDVGYGKTEVAIRAAFKAVLDGKQVAVLVPTTVLALQHERSFQERLKEQAVRVGALSRFKSTKEIKETLEGLKEGRVDIAIGTHRLLSKDVRFKDLGLLIIDEEQRFGVEHKERLKALKVNTDVLTLTATPIPRTLQLSLMGMRDISVINTPPVDRLSIRTYVARFDEEVIRNAIDQEIARGGQVFFIHNRVQSIGAIHDRLRSICPKARIIVAHGQLEESELEKRMLEFYNKKADVLLCTTIIESGLDIPSANTILLDRADTFGLSQLYQLRGRVGRSQARAYCYLLLPEEAAITDDAKKRLEVIQRFVDLGSGFKIASHDLELRGGGDILGKSQTGHIASVGYELYMELLDEAVRELHGTPVEDHFDPEIKIPFAALIPEAYVPDVHQRLGLYKRLSSATDTDGLHDLEREMQDRYGKAPEEAQNLLWLIRIKQVLRRLHVKSLTAGKDRVALDVGEGSKLSPEKVLAAVRKNPKFLSVTPDSKIVIKKAFPSPQTLYQEIHQFMTQVAEA